SGGEDHVGELIVIQHSVASDLLRRQRHAFCGGLIQDGSTYAPAKECLDRLQSLVGGDGGPALFNGRDQLNYVPLGDLMNALLPPGLATLPAKQPSYLAARAVLRQMQRYKGLQQILDTVRHDTSPRRSLLSRQITAIEPRREHLLRRHASLMKGHAPVGPDGVFAQLRAGAGGPIQDDEHLAALRCYLDAEAGAAGVPVDCV